MQAVTRSFTKAWEKRCHTRATRKERKWLKRYANKAIRRYGKALCIGRASRKDPRPITGWDVI